MFDLALLGLLTDQELHGYELKKRLADLLGGRSSISFGSLYPALARLEKQGAVKAVEQRTEVPASPMSGSLAGELAAFRARSRAVAARTRSGRGKKVYGITDLGRARLTELLTDPDVSDDRSFELKVALCRHLPPGDRVELFERRRAELVRRRDSLRQRDQPVASPTAGTGRLDRYRRALLERDSTTIDHDLAWIDRLLESERQAFPQEEPT
jgi:DNA-binding PadR family transcriptional regulator